MNKSSRDSNKENLNVSLIDAPIDIPQEGNLRFTSLKFVDFIDIFFSGRMG